MAIAPQTKPNGRERVTFSYKSEAGTRIALVLSYLMGKVDHAIASREGKQRAADAMLAFWLPYAMKGQNHGVSKWDELQQAAKRSVEALTRQVKNLCADFQVELPWDTKPMQPVHPEVLSWLQTLVDGTAAGKSNGVLPMPSECLTVQDQLPEEEAIFVDDDELLGDLV
jgi:hypothetical protein